MVGLCFGVSKLGALLVQSIRPVQALCIWPRRRTCVVALGYAAIGVVSPDWMFFAFDKDTSSRRSAWGEMMVPSAQAGGRKGGGGAEPSRSFERREVERSRETPRQSQDEPRASRHSTERRGSEPASDDDRRREDASGSQRETRDDRDQRSARGKSAEREERDDTRHEARPPATLVEAFERLFKPSSPKGPISAQKPGTVPRPFVVGPLPAIGTKSYSTGEVLAVNLSTAAISRARERGFVVEKSAPLSRLKSSITRLIPPAGMDAAQARTLLHGELPTEQFALNRIYRVYRAANQGLSRQAERTAPARVGGSVACEKDHCTGREIIQWKDRLRACSKGLRVGVIDTGVDHLHPAFEAVRLKIDSFLPEGRLPAPNWHGTGVLSLLAGNPSSGTAGLIPHSEFHAANVFFADDTGDFATDTVSLLKALDWMSAFDVKIINMSFTGPKDELVQKAIAGMSGKGVIFVAAAGNDGPAAPPGYPAAYKQVVAVTAVNKSLRNFPYANRGAHIDVAAPGVEIWTAVPDAREGYHTGTSFAAPYVTAILATIANSAPRRQKKELLSLLPTVDLGPPGRDPIYGQGLLVAPDGCQPVAVASTPAERPNNSAVKATASSWSTAVIVGPTASPPVSAGFK